MDGPLEVLHNQYDIMNKMRMRAQSLVLFLSTEFPLYYRLRQRWAYQQAKRHWATATAAKKFSLAQNHNIEFVRSFAILILQSRF